MDGVALSGVVDGGFVAAMCLMIWEAEFWDAYELVVNSILGARVFVMVADVDGATVGLWDRFGACDMTENSSWLVVDVFGCWTVGSILRCEGFSSSVRGVDGIVDGYVGRIVERRVDGLILGASIPLMGVCEVVLWLFPVTTAGVLGMGAPLALRLAFRGFFGSEAGWLVGYKLLIKCNCRLIVHSPVDFSTANHLRRYYSEQ